MGIGLSLEIRLRKYRGQTNSIRWFYENDIPLFLLMLGVSFMSFPFMYVIILPIDSLKYFHFVILLRPSICTGKGETNAKYAFCKKNYAFTRTCVKLTF